MAMFYGFGEFELDGRSYELRRGGEPISLEPKILDLLLHLVRNRERVVSKEELLEAVWPGTVVSDSALTKTISQARAAGIDVGPADAPERVIRLVTAISGALAKAEGSSSDIYVGGTSQLAALWEDLANVSSVLGILEEEGALRGMLGDDTSEGTTVRIGAELNISDVDLAVVSTTYGAGDQGAGRVGVIGPMRMDYRRTIKIVEEVGDGLADSLGT